MSPALPEPGPPHPPRRCRAGRAGRRTTKGRSRRAPRSPWTDGGHVQFSQICLVLGTLVLLLTVRDQTHGVKYNDNHNDNTLRAPRGDQSLCGGL